MGAMERQLPWASLLLLLPLALCPLAAGQEAEERITGTGVSRKLKDLDAYGGKWPYSWCSRCPGPQWVRHTGYQAFAHWTLKPGAANLLPRSFCPPKTQAALAKEAIDALAAAGYAQTARILEASGALMGLDEPGTLFAPSDEAYEAGNLPVHLYRMLQAQEEEPDVVKDESAEDSFADSLKNGGALESAALFAVSLKKEGAQESAALSTDSLKNEGAQGSAELYAGLRRNLMRYHIIRDFRTYKQVQDSPVVEHPTLLASASLESRGFVSGDVGFVKLQQVPETQHSLPALVVKKDMFCSSLLIVHGVNRVLIPPVEYLPAGTPAAPVLRVQQELEHQHPVKTVTRTARVLTY